jgi:hypothetical protein
MNEASAAMQRSHRIRKIFARLSARQVFDLISIWITRKHEGYHADRRCSRCQPGEEGTEGKSHACESHSVSGTRRNIDQVRLTEPLLPMEAVKTMFKRAQHPGKHLK